MRKITMLTAAAAYGLSLAVAHAADPVTIQLKWVAQAQFAGYFVAKDKGFYKDAGLDVTINPGGPGRRPAASDRRRRRRCGGRLDAVSAGVAREGRAAGQHLADLQAFRPGADLPQATPASRSLTDFKGKTIGIWYGGNEYPFLSWMSKLGYKTDGSPDGVKVLKQGFNVDPMLQKQADCVSTMTYNEYWQVIDGGYKPSHSSSSNMRTKAWPRWRTGCG